MEGKMETSILSGIIWASYKDSSLHSLLARGKLL